MGLAVKSCYVCGTENNPIIATEPIEHRFGKPLMPEPFYNFARCRKCSTLYVDSSVTDEYLAGIYVGESMEGGEEVLGGEYDKIMANRLPEFRRHWQLIKRIRRPQTNDRVLDIGAQTGDFGLITQRDGVVPNAIELSQEYARVCQRRWGGSSRVHCGPVVQAPFGRGEFQYITAFETLEHVCDPISVLQQVRPWLAPDGVIAISVPSSDYFHFKFWLLRRSFLAKALKPVAKRRLAIYGHQILPHTHVYSFSPTSVRLAMNRAGYKVVYEEPTGWHGQSRFLNRVSRAVLPLTASRVAMAPSVFTVAKLA